jgi:hypothetical protein
MSRSSTNQLRTAAISAHTATAALATGTHTVADGSGTAEADITIDEASASAAADIVIAAGNAEEGDTLEVDASVLGGPVVTFTFTATPVLDTDVEIGADADATAAALEAALDLAGNGLADYTTATVVTDTVTLTADVAGVIGNGVALATSAPLNIELESPTLEGGVGNAIEGDTVTIDATPIGGPSVTFTFTIDPVAATDVQIGADATVTAQALEDAIELEANGLATDYVATANNVANVVTVVAAAEGRKGNAIELSAVGDSVAVESATLEGGAGSASDGDTFTVGTTVFTWSNDADPAVTTEVQIGDTAELCAANLEAAVEAHALTGTQVTGATVGRVVTWTAIPYGAPGHFALAETGDSTTVSAAAMAGGVAGIIAQPGAGKRIVVLGYQFSPDANGEVTFYSGLTALSGAMEILADVPLQVFNEDGVQVCAPNEPWSMLATQAANGYVTYVIERTERVA